MNDIQKTEIINFRTKGIGYSTIAKKLGISENTVKSYCRRNNLTKAEKISEISADIKTSAEKKCKFCGKQVQQNEKRKEKLFCSDKCRMDWWNSHRDEVKHKKVITMICPNCNKSFNVYGNSHRKYCSHSCYISDRFGGGSDG